jgi:transglutaminase-like putative cysteine protease
VHGGENRPLLAWLFELELLGPRMTDLWASIRGEGDETTRAAGLLILGAIGWTTAQFGASGIFRFDRGMPAVTAAGVPLLVVLASPGPNTEINVVLTLAAFTFAAMVLLVRMQLNQQRSGWARRHIADTSDVSRLFLRTGVFFVAFTVVGASTLTAASQNASFEGALPDIDVSLPDVEWPGWLLDIFEVETTDGTVASIRGGAPSEQDWEPVEGWAFTVDGNPTRNYWWLTAWDYWDGTTFRRSSRDETKVQPLGWLVPLPEYDVEGRGEAVRHTLQIGDTGHARTTVVGPSEARTVEGVEGGGSRVFSIGRKGSRALVEYEVPQDVGTQITIESSSIDYDTESTRVNPGSTPVNEEALRNAPRDLPDDIAMRYVGAKNHPPGPRMTEFIAQTQQWADANPRQHNAYDIARKIEADFTDLTVYEYNDKMTEVCAGLTQPECVLTHQQGFCTFYAQTMTIALQAMAIPSRYVWGYLPGPAENLDGRHEVDNSWLHAWTEVYFDGFGWIRFDPTPGGRFGQTPFHPRPEPPGPELPEEPDPSLAASPDPIDTPVPTIAPTPSSPPTDGPRGALAAFIDWIVGGPGGGLWLLLIGALTFAVVMAVAALRLLRLPGRDPGLAYRGIVGLATRFGYGPHPSQTELEYAASLSERIPSANDDLYLVVNTQVENTYAETPADSAARKPLGLAYARIRTALVRMRLRRNR